jgi:uncharacterized tellurite resistance protein B-like protein
MEKEAHLANLIKIARADGEVHPMESLMIQGIAARMGINHQTFTKTSWYPDHASKAVPIDEETRYRHLCELIILTQVDLNKSNEEEKLLLEIAKRLHIPTEKVEKIRDFLSENKLPDNAKALMDRL